MKGDDLGQEACSIVLDLIVAEVQLKQALIAMLLESSADLGCPSITKLIAPQVNLAQGGVEHEEVGQGAGPFLRPHLAPPQPQLLHLQPTATLIPGPRSFVIALKTGPNSSVHLLQVGSVQTQTACRSCCKSLGLSPCQACCSTGILRSSPLRQQIRITLHGEPSGCEGNVEHTCGGYLWCNTHCCVLM